jgi:hypothetical protein
MTKPKRVCVFCGGRPLTLEHVFSSSLLATLTPSAEAIATQYASQLGPDEPVRQRTWQRALGKGGGAEFRTVCRHCNNGWMQQLDEQAKPLLWRLCFLESGQVAFPDGNLVLSQWATKIALVLHSIWSDPFIASDEYAQFRKDQQPLAGSIIWIGAMSRVADGSGRQMMSTLESSGDRKAYLATFRLLHVVFQVLCPKPDARVDRIRGFERFVRQLWPPETPMDWPPPRDAWLRTEQDFAALDTAFTEDPQ